MAGIGVDGSRCQGTNVPMCQRANVPTFQCANVPMGRCADVQMKLRRTGFHFRGGRGVGVLQMTAVALLESMSGSEA